MGVDLCIYMYTSSYIASPEMVSGEAKIPMSCRLPPVCFQTCKAVIIGEPRCSDKRGLTVFLYSINLHAEVYSHIEQPSLRQDLQTTKYYAI